jgi:hypothetical protein
MNDKPLELERLPAGTYFPGRIRRVKEAMPTPTQNQAQAGPPINVLHDQRVPNTLGGIGLPAVAARRRLPTGAIVLAVVIIVALLVIVVTR